MSERINRLIMGFSLIVFLLLEWNYGVYAIIFIMIFEGATNWRIPRLVSQLRYATDGIDRDENEHCVFSYEAERLMRFVAASIIGLGFIFFDELLWFLPWFVGLNLLLAGTIGFCPMVMLFRNLGFK